MLLIRKAKILMVTTGYDFYNNPRLGKVPISAVEKLLGTELELQKNENKEA